MPGYPDADCFKLRKNIRQREGMRKKETKTARESVYLEKRRVRRDEYNRE